jgi:hypothetical protein
MSSEVVRAGKVAGSVRLFGGGRVVDFDSSVRAAGARSILRSTAGVDVLCRAPVPFAKNLTIRSSEHRGDPRHTVRESETAI